MYNLLVTSKEDAWKDDSYFFEVSRALNVHECTDESIATLFGELSSENVDAIKQMPCIFAYENHLKLDPKFGYITEVIKRHGKVKISYELIEIDDFLNVEQMAQAGFDLDISGYALNRTHWAIKDVDLQSQLLKLGIEIPERDSTPDIPSEAKASTDDILIANKETPRKSDEVIARPKNIITATLRFLNGNAAAFGVVAVCIAGLWSLFLYLDGQERHEEVQLIALREELKKPFRLARSEVNLRGMVQKETVDQCSLTVKDTMFLYPMPDDGAIAATLQLIASSSIKEDLIEILIVQLQDQNHSVRLGALILLDRLQAMPDKAEVILNDVSISNLELSSDVYISFNHSFVDHLTCKSCEVQAYRSLLMATNVKELRSRQSFIAGTPPEQISSAENNAFYFSMTFGGRGHDPTMVNEIIQKNANFRLGAIASGLNDREPDPYKPACKEIRYFCKFNRFSVCGVVEKQKASTG